MPCILKKSLSKCNHLRLFIDLAYLNDRYFLSNDNVNRYSNTSDWVIYNNDYKCDIIRILLKTNVNVGQMHNDNSNKNNLFIIYFILRKI